MNLTLWLKRQPVMIVHGYVAGHSQFRNQRGAMGGLFGLPADNFSSRYS